MAGSRVVVTGAAGSIGSHVIPMLLEDPEVDRVLGIDVVPSRGSVHPKWTMVQKDIRDPGIHSIFKGADCLVHLAFVVRNIHDNAETRDINVAGTENLLKACQFHGVRKIVFTSSAAVYGYGSPSVLDVREDRPLRPDSDHIYSVCKAIVEARLREFNESRQESILCVLRPILVVGPGVRNSFARMFQREFLVSVRGFDPLVQALHVKDMAYAIFLAVKKDCPGTYNVGPRDAVFSSEICRHFHIRRIQIPRYLFGTWLSLLYRCKVSSIPPQSASRFLYSLTVDSTRFRESFKWEPLYSTLESIGELRRARKNNTFK